MNWTMFPMPEVVDINPRRPQSIKLIDDDPITFVPMMAVSEKNAVIEAAEVRPYGEVKKGFTYFENKDVLFAKITPCMENGKSALAFGLKNNIGFGSTEFHVLRANQNVLDPRFLHYFIRRQTFRKEAKLRMRGAAGQQRVPQDFFEDVLIPLPCISEQRRIVEILDQADTLRKKRAEADAKAARILPALFYKIIGDQVTNPHAYPKVSVGELVERIQRRNPTDSPDNTFKYVDISGVDGESGKIVEFKELAGREAPSRARQVIRTNDILISTVRPYLRATALVPAELDNEICSTGFCVLRARNNKGFGYLYTLSRLRWFTESLNSMARGASYPAVTDNDVLGFRVSYPTDNSKIKQFDDVILRLIELQDSRRNSSNMLDNLFATILHQAFTGDLTHKWREVHMEELLAEMEAQAKVLG
ncbi:MAG: restriction endonuclease subunit S [Deltaproteobacteria bacterium]|nr:restriction endonuclease subunit S [Deltaproteobacteria bacterium]